MHNFSFVYLFLSSESRYLCYACGAFFMVGGALNGLAAGGGCSDCPFIELEVRFHIVFIL